MTQTNKDKDKAKLEAVAPEAAATANDNDWENKYRRALADYQNLLKQTAKDKSDFARFANRQLLLALLPIHDNLQASLAHFKDDEAKAVQDGLGHVLKQFDTVLSDFNVQPITALGEPFDHNLMEALSQTETEDEALADQVAQVVQNGYKLYDQVLRPARVIVYKLKI